jgi:cytochrome c oxidase cbb3-type subunit III
MADPTKPEPIEKARQRPEPGFTGHEWDGIKEYDNPLPRWWLWIFYATVIWSLGYWVLYPAWPMLGQATQGVLGYSTRADAAAEIVAHRGRFAPLEARLAETDLGAVAEDFELLRFATAGGAAVFRNHCSQCHGAGAQGAPGGYPSLLDDAWLWGGTIDAIHETIAHGVRYDPDPLTRWSQMPAFGEMLPEEEIDGLVEYVRALSGQEHDAALAEAHAETFEVQCSACHGLQGEGNQDLGAPNLADGIWQYGGDRDSIRHTIVYSRYGQMPAFGERLREVDVRKVAIYVHGLGGGQ